VLSPLASAGRSAPRSPQVRSLTLYGAYLAGAAFAVAGSGLHHKSCHVLGGAYNLPHANAHVAWRSAAMVEDPVAELGRVMRAGSE
jgi:alcohol dehydrogenase class IV